MNDWVVSHVVQVPEQTRAFCGDALRNTRMLNVGCGEMLTDLGLLSLGPKMIVGLDIDPKPDGWLEMVVAKVRANHLPFPQDYADRIEYVRYGGEVFPFEDNSFDFIFSWSAFEHIERIDLVLEEMLRVLTPDGQAFVQVFPWYFSRYGSHLESWIHKPFFHLVHDADWVKSALDQYVAEHPEQDANFISVYMLKEFRQLNRKSASDFYRAARKAGFSITKAQIVAYEEDLSEAPAGVDFADLMISGTMMLMKKATPG